MQAKACAGAEEAEKDADTRSVNPTMETPEVELSMSLGALLSQL